MIGSLSSNGENRTKGMLLFSREQEATTQKGGARLVFEDSCLEIPLCTGELKIGELIQRLRMEASVALEVVHK